MCLINETFILNSGYMHSDIFSFFICWSPLSTRRINESIVRFCKAGVVGTIRLFITSFRFLSIPELSSLQTWILIGG